MKTCIALAAACAFTLALAPAQRAVAAYGPAGASRAAIAKDQASARAHAAPVKLAKSRHQNEAEEDPPRKGWGR
jgi:hypothetical protein